MQSHMTRSHHTLRPSRRRGAVLVLAAVVMVVMLGFVAFTTDVGRIMLTRTQLQVAADSAAMASAWELLEERRLRDDASEQSMRAAAVAESNEYIGHYWIDGKPLQGTERNVAFGYLAPGQVFVESNDFQIWDSVRVRIGRTATDNGPLELFFAPAIGSKTANVTAEAVATFRGNIIGFRPTGENTRTSVIPFTIQVDAWRNVLNGIGDDDWSYDAGSRSVASGADQIHELRIFPNRTGGAGNFGALTIGGSASPGNQALLRQINAGGLSAADLESYGGQLSLDPGTGTLVLPGDTGITTDILRGTETLVGRAVTFPLYSRVVGQGTNARFTIVGFAGARVMDVRTTGGRRSIIVQPAVVIDRTAVPGRTSSWNVYQPVKLTN